MINDDRFTPTLSLLPCPFCGKPPSYVKKRVCCGHGEYPLCAHVECEACRVSTSEFIIDGFYGCTDTADTPVLHWNFIMAHFS
jgi:hypothetical protein